MRAFLSALVICSAAFLCTGCDDGSDPGVGEDLAPAEQARADEYNAAMETETATTETAP